MDQKKSPEACDITLVNAKVNSIFTLGFNIKQAESSLKAALLICREQILWQTIEGGSTKKAVNKFCFTGKKIVSGALLVFLKVSGIEKLYEQGSITIFC